MATLKEFEEALRAAGNTAALEILESLRARDRGQRSIRPARRITGRKMTPELAVEILRLHQTTDMTQQEIAFELGVNQGRVNEVIKRRKWLDDDPEAPEAQARDKAKQRAKDGVGFTPRSAAPGDAAPAESNSAEADLAEAAPAGASPPEPVPVPPPPATEEPVPEQGPAEPEAAAAPAEAPAQAPPEAPQEAPQEAPPGAPGPVPDTTSDTAAAELPIPPPPAERTDSEAAAKTPRKGKAASRKPAKPADPPAQLDLL